MYYAILVIVTANILALTLPLTLRLAFIISDISDVIIEYIQRKN